MTDAWDDEDRAIARALGAEMPESEASPSPDPGAVGEYEAVLASLPFEEVSPRPELENEMVATALGRRPAAARAIASAPSHVREAHIREAHIREAHIREAHTRRTVSTRWIATGVAVAAAAAIAVALAVGGTATGPASPGGRIAPAAATGSVERVLAEPGTRTGALHASNGATTGRVALGADGQGFLYGLTPGAARWLWLDTGSDQVRVGQLGNASTVHFVVRGDVEAVKRVLVTTERGTPATPGPVQSVAELD